jgi:hypothetical protein
MDINDPTEDDKRLFLAMSERISALYKEKKQTEKTRALKLRLQDDLDRFLSVRSVLFRKLVISHQ